ncbi:MAG TPA: carboxypeptidase regulatory-like domain-containing protein, partial [Terriglobales bacterium]|nr:carboxypeptidase regulatory-like domain-containing protein [Terriglobales bacterium]
MKAMRAVILFVFILPPCFAQTVTTGELTGTTTDATGAVVSGALIVLRNADTGETRTVVSNPLGAYRFTFLRPGSYDLSASFNGLISDRLRISIDLSQVFVANLQMRVEGTREVVQVIASAALLESDNAQSTYTLSQRQLDQLPMPGGDLVSVAYSAPGVVIANHNGSGRFAFQGIGSVSNLFTLNGADEMDPYFNVNNSGTTGLLLGANEIQEASVIQNAYEGQYGRQAGAQVNYVSKSGSNSFHGNLTYTYNGTLLNANDYFNNANGVKRPRTVSNEYAASFGGPIIHDKLFFFADIEGLRYALPGSASIIAVPSKALEQFSLNSIQPAQVSLYKQAFNIYDAAPGHANAVSVTNGNSPLQDSSGQLGCGALAGTATGFGGTFGKTVSCADSYPTVIASDTSEWLVTARLDYNVSSRQQVYLRFKTNHGARVTNTSAVSPVFNVLTNEPDYEAQFNHTFAISPHLTNNLIGGISYYSYVSSFANGAAAVAAFPFRFNVNDGGANGSGGFAGLGVPAAFPNGDRAVNVQFIDDTSFAAGNHSLKFGINYRHTRETDFQFSAADKIGRFNFFALSDFANGVVSSNTGSSYFQRFPTVPILHLRLYNLGFYVQDQWAPAPNLKFTATVRFDGNGNPDCLDKCFTRFISPFGEIQNGTSVPYNQSIQTGLAHAYYNIDGPAVEPRFSLTYSPEWAQGTVLRAGIGLFTDLYPAVWDSALAQNAPNVFSPLIHAGLVDKSGAQSAPAIAAASAAAFQKGFASGATLDQLQAAVAPARFTPPNFFSIPQTFSTPKFLEWSAEIQREVGERNVLSLRYAGNHGYNLFLLNSDVNAAVNTTNYPQGFGGLPLATPDPRFAVVIQLTNSGYSNYDGLTASFRRSMASGLQGQISYTWSHALDLVSNGGLTDFAGDSVSSQINPLSLRSLNYGSSDYDVRHNLTLDFVWDVPGRRQHGVLRSILGGWSVAGKT